MLPTLRANRTLLAWVILSMAALVVAAAFLGYAVAQSSNAARDRLDAQHIAIHQSCLAIQNLNRVITASLQRSRRNLPRIQYYQQHPVELARQLAEVDRELRVFRPRTCP